MMKNINGIIDECIRQIQQQFSGSERPNERQIAAALDAILRRKSSFLYMKVSERRYIRSEVINAILYQNVLTGLLRDEAVTEIMVNGPERIYIEKRGRIQLSGIKFRSQDDATKFAQDIVPGNSVSFANPIGNARLPEGYRVNVVLDPVALDSPVITIRKFSKKPMSIDMLIRYNSINEEVADKLEKLVRAKYNIFVAGGTGSGKTTFLNALSNFIPRTERVITIEDPAELQLDSVENLVRMETRGGGHREEAITIQDLIKSSLRMRPDRIVVGEVRGEEALDMLQAMNTGHEGSMSTGHANSCKGMLRRLESLVLSGEAGGKLPVPVIRTQIAESLDLMIHLGRLRDRSRRVLEICEILDVDDKGEIQVNPIYKFQETGVDANGKIIGVLARTENEFKNVEKLRFAGIEDVI